MDAKCVVCGEPWEVPGLSDSMEKWELQLFKDGAGCPCCEGSVPRGEEFEPKTAEDLEYGDRDPMERLNAWGAAKAGAAPKWEKPAPTVLWTCDACGIQSVKDANDELGYEVARGTVAAQWYHGHPLDGCEGDEEPWHTFPGGTKLCRTCTEHCYECDTEVSSSIEGDTYDEGVCHPHPDLFSKVICTSCLEQMSEEE